MYQSLIKPLLFALPPEQAHELTTKLIKGFLMDRGKTHRVDRLRGLNKEVFGLDFPNPIGLAAGFDKNAELVDQWGALGFGFVEIGTVTPKPQLGNPQPRLFRLPMDEALINRMGFNNEGVEAVAKRLAKRKSHIIVGGNIGKNKDTPNDRAVDDYMICFQRLFDLVDYFVVNVSSPNTPGLRELQEKEPLMKLLSEIQEINYGRSKPKPLLLKIAPDLSEGQIDDIVEIALSVQLSGLIATNTTISRQGLVTPSDLTKKIGLGGLSGKPVFEVSTLVLKQLHAKLGTKIPLIGVGGIGSSEAAVAKMEAGASLIQLYSGFVYGGLPLIKTIKQGLIDHFGRS